MYGPSVQQELVIGEVVSTTYMRALLSIDFASAALGDVTGAEATGRQGTGVFASQQGRAGWTQLLASVDMHPPLAHQVSPGSPSQSPPPGTQDHQHPASVSHPQLLQQRQRQQQQQLPPEPQQEQLPRMSMAEHLQRQLGASGTDFQYDSLSDSVDPQQQQDSGNMDSDAAQDQAQSPLRAFQQSQEAPEGAAELHHQASDAQEQSPDNQEQQHQQEGRSPTIPQTDGAADSESWDSQPDSPLNQPAHHHGQQQPDQDARPQHFAAASRPFQADGPAASLRSKRPPANDSTPTRLPQNAPATASLQATADAPIADAAPKAASRRRRSRHVVQHAVLLAAAARSAMVAAGSPEEEESRQPVQAAGFQSEPQLPSWLQRTPHITRQFQSEPQMGELASDAAPYHQPVTSALPERTAQQQHRLLPVNPSSTHCQPMTSAVPEHTAQLQYALPPVNSSSSQLGTLGGQRGLGLTQQTVAGPHTQQLLPSQVISDSQAVSDLQWWNHHSHSQAMPLLQPPGRLHISQGVSDSRTTSDLQWQSNQPHSQAMSLLQPHGRHHASQMVSDSRATSDLQWQNNRPHSQVLPLLQPRSRLHASQVVSDSRATSDNRWAQAIPLEQAQTTLQPASEPIMSEMNPAAELAWERPDERPADQDLAPPQLHNADPAAASDDFEIIISDSQPSPLAPQAAAPVDAVSKDQNGNSPASQHPSASQSSPAAGPAGHQSLSDFHADHTPVGSLTLHPDPTGAPDLQDTRLASSPVPGRPSQSKHPNAFATAAGYSTSAESLGTGIAQQDHVSANEGVSIADTPRPPQPVSLQGTLPDFSSSKGIADIAAANALTPVLMPHAQAHIQAQHGHTASVIKDTPQSASIAGAWSTIKDTPAFSLPRPSFSLNKSAAAHTPAMPSAIGMQSLSQSVGHAINAAAAQLGASQPQPTVCSPQEHHTATAAVPELTLRLSLSDDSPQGAAQADQLTPRNAPHHSAVRTASQHAQLGAPASSQPSQAVHAHSLPQNVHTPSVSTKSQSANAGSGKGLDPGMLRHFASAPDPTRAPSNEAKQSDYPGSSHLSSGKSHAISHHVEASGKVSSRAGASNILNIEAANSPMLEDAAGHEAAILTAEEPMLEDAAGPVASILAAEDSEEPMLGSDAPDEPRPAADNPDDPKLISDTADEPLPDSDIPDEPMPASDTPDEPIPGCSAPDAPKPGSDTPDEPMPASDTPKERIPGSGTPDAASRASDGGSHHSNQSPRPDNSHEPSGAGDDPEGSEPDDPADASGYSTPTDLVPHRFRQPAPTQVMCMLEAIHQSSSCQVSE